MVDNRQAQENRDLRKEIDNKQDESEQQKLRRLVEESREWLDEMKDELHEKITIDVVQAAQREEMAREMERWQAEFEARMAAAVSGQARRCLRCQRAVTPPVFVEKSLSSFNFPRHSPSHLLGHRKLSSDAEVPAYFRVGPVRKTAKIGTGTATPTLPREGAE